MQHTKTLSTIIKEDYIRINSAKFTYGDNSIKRYRNILRHELELKWIKLLQTTHPLCFNDNIYHEGNISRLPDFDVFSLLDIRKRNNPSHGKCKNGNLKRKNKHVLALSELSIILNILADIWPFHI